MVDHISKPSLVLLSSVDPLEFIHEALSGSFKTGYLQINDGEKPSVVMAGSSSKPIYQQFKTLTTEEIALFVYSLIPDYLFKERDERIIDTTIGPIILYIRYKQSYHNYLAKTSLLNNMDGLQVTIRFLSSLYGKGKK